MPRKFPDEDRIMGLPIGIAPSRSLKTLNCWIFKDLNNNVGIHICHFILLITGYSATSTDVDDRAFSHGGLTVSKVHHFLSDKSTRAATVLGVW